MRAKFHDRNSLFFAVLCSLWRSRSLRRNRPSNSQLSKSGESSPNLGGFTRLVTGKRQFAQLVTRKRPQSTKKMPTMTRKEIVSPNRTLPNNGVSAKASATNGYARDSGVKLR